MKLSIALLAFLLLLAPPTARAQDDAPKSGESSAEELVVGTIPAPPFAMRGKDGEWTGLAIELWKRLAQNKQLPYRIVERQGIDDLLRAVQLGEVDVAAAALTITPERERVVAFSVPFYPTGVGIAVPIAGGSDLPILGSLSGLNLRTAAIILAGLAAALVLALAGVEHFSRWRRRRKAEANFWLDYRKRDANPIFHPQTLGGRALGILAVISICLAAASGAASYLTQAGPWRVIVDSPDDLETARIGVLVNSAASAYLAQQELQYRSFPDLFAGLEALRAGEVDAVVDDRPVLVWLVMQHFPADLEVLPDILVPERYGFVMRLGDPRQARINDGLEEILKTDWWKVTLSRYFGPKP